MSDRAPTAAEEWKANWGLAVAAMLGLSFGSVPAATLGLFMEPLEAEFGWSRAMISGGMMVFAAIGLPLTPFAGALADKVGSRACVIPGLAACSIAFAAFGLMTGAPFLWWAIWVVWIYDITGSYALVLLIAIPSVLAAGLLLVGLGAYPQFEAAAQKEDEQ